MQTALDRWVAGAADRIIGDGEAARGVIGERKGETAPLKVVGTWERPSTNRRIEPAEA